MMNDLLSIPEGHIPPFADVKTAASLLGLPDIWLKEQVRSGKLPSILIGKTLRVHIGQIEEQVVGMCNTQEHGKRPMRNNNLAKWRERKAKEEEGGEKDDNLS